MTAVETATDARKVMIATAARLGSVRLIDNVVLEMS